MVELVGTVNIAAFDLPWSAVHLGSGIAVGVGLRLVRHHSHLRQRLVIGVAILIAWEIFEYSFVATGLVEAESIVNIVSDLVIGSVGIIAVLHLARPPQPSP